MRGLTARERYLLALHATSASDAVTDDDETDTLPLIERGLVRHWVTETDGDGVPDGEDLDDWETYWWDTTATGRWLLGLYESGAL